MNFPNVPNWFIYDFTYNPSYFIVCLTILEYSFCLVQSLVVGRNRDSINSRETVDKVYDMMYFNRGRPVSEEPTNRDKHEMKQGRR